MIISFISINFSYETQKTCRAVNHTFRGKITIVHYWANALLHFWKCIQTRQKRLKHYDFGKIIALGSKNGFKMGGYCYHMLEGVPLNISRCVPNHWPNSALWSIHMISTQNRGVKIPLLNFVCDF